MYNKQSLWRCKYLINIFNQTLKAKLNKDVLSDHLVTAKDLVKSIKTKAKGFTCQSGEDEITFTYRGKVEEIKELYALKEKIKKIMEMKEI